MKLSQVKEKSLNTKIISKLETVNNLRAASNLIGIFLKEFKQVSVVWKVFLHIPNLIDFQFMTSTSTGLIDL